MALNHPVSFQLITLAFPLLGWKSARTSTEPVYPIGLNTSVMDDDMDILYPPTLNFAALAEVAVGADAGWVNTARNFKG